MPKEHTADQCPQQARIGILENNYKLVMDELHDIKSNQIMMLDKLNWFILNAEKTYSTKEELAKQIKDRAWKWTEKVIYFFMLAIGGGFVTIVWSAIYFFLRYGSK